MGFQTPQYQLSEYLQRTTTGKIQLPDFQRGYKWDDERIRSLLVTIIMGHPLGVVMLLKTGNTQIRFKPKPLEGSRVPAGTEPESLLLDGQQRLTSLTQALTYDGLVHTKDVRGKLLDRRYYLNIETALLGPDRYDEALVSIPADGKIKANFDRDVLLDLSTPEMEQRKGYFPLRLLCDPMSAANWLWQFGVRGEISTDPQVAAQAFMAEVVTPANSYAIPAIELDQNTNKGAVATVFEKVNTGGLPLNVFELLTATYAGDAAYFEATGSDFRLTDDWKELQATFAAHGVLGQLESTDFLQAATLLATLKRNQVYVGFRPPRVSGRREDILRLELSEYVECRELLRDSFVWTAKFLADEHIFDVRFLPYPKQLVPLAAIRAILGQQADQYAVRERLSQWFWCGIMGELYGGSIETRFVRDLEEVPAWALSGEDVLPRTVQDFGFQQSRLLTLRTRNAAAYKGIYALILKNGAKDWMYDHELGKVQYVDLAVDIHHIFPKRWCERNGIGEAHRDSIVNKTPLAAATNRAIGGDAPVRYLDRVEKRSGLSPARVDALLATHLINPEALRRTDFDAHFDSRVRSLCALVASATGRPVAEDLAEWMMETDLNSYDLDDPAVAADPIDQEDDDLLPDVV